MEVAAKKRGRPLRENHKRLRFSFTLHPDDAHWLSTQAKAERISKSELLDSLLRDAKRRSTRRTFQIPISDVKLRDICQRHQVARLAFFGSILTDHFKTESDVDVLVEFMGGQKPGLFDLAQLSTELSTALGNRTIDLKTAAELSRYFRDSVIAEAQTFYVA